MAIASRSRCRADGCTTLGRDADAAAHRRTRIDRHRAAVAADGRTAVSTGASGCPPADSAIGRALSQTGIRGGIGEDTQTACAAAGIGRAAIPARTALAGASISAAATAGLAAHGRDRDVAQHFCGRDAHSTCIATRGRTAVAAPAAEAEATRSAICRPRRGSAVAGLAWSRLGSEDVVPSGSGYGNGTSALAACPSRGITSGASDRAASRAARGDRTLDHARQTDVDCTAVAARRCTAAAGITTGRITPRSAVCRSLDCSAIARRATGMGTAAGAACRIARATSTTRAADRRAAIAAAACRSRASEG